MRFPKPLIKEHAGFLVVRDDLLEGGTKRRAIDAELIGANEFVYASPAYGYAQVALALACKEKGLQATIFTAKRNKPHKRTLEAKAAGAKIIQVPYGYLSNVQSKARHYAETFNAKLLPFGFNTEAIRTRLATVVKEMDIKPKEVWTVSGSATLTTILQSVWSDAEFYAVQVGAVHDCGKAKVFVAKEKFEDDAKQPPPFPSCSNYDAKVWRVMNQHASPRALFWNVAA